VWKDIASAVRLTGYDHGLSLEHEGGRMSFDEGVRKAKMLCMKRLWKKTLEKCSGLEINRTKLICWSMGINYESIWLSMQVKLNSFVPEMVEVVL
jgi:hypothetical protein